MLANSDFELTYRTIVDPYEYLWIIIMTKTLEDNVAGLPLLVIL